MSAFPTLSHHTSSTRQPNDGQQVDYGDDGAMRVRVMYETTQWTFHLVLDALPAADIATLLAHYATNKTASFSYTWPEDASVYTCGYAAHPALAISEAYARQDAVVDLVGVAQ